MSAPTPDALAAAERDVRVCRDAIDTLTRALWRAQSLLLAAIDAGDGWSTATWRGFIGAATDRVSEARAAYDLAFDALTALRGAQWEAAS